MTLSDAIVLFPWSGDWRVADVRDPAKLTVIADTANCDTASAVDHMMQTLGLAPGEANSAIIVLPTNRCLSASVDLAAAGRTPSRQALLYELEEQMPAALEDLCCDLVMPADIRPRLRNAVSSKGAPRVWRRALGVCTDRRNLAELIDLLHHRGVTVTAVCPAALLAMQGWGRALREPLMAPRSVVVWQNGAAVDVIAVRMGRPTDWHTTPAERNDVAFALAAMGVGDDGAGAVALVGVDEALAGGDGGDAGAVALVGVDEALAGGDGGDAGAVARVGVDEALAASLGALPMFKNAAFPRLDARSLDEGAIVAARAVASGRLRPWIDLLPAESRGAVLRNRGVRRAGMAAAAALVIACAAICGAMLWRGERYAAAADVARSAQLEIFHQLFPNQDIPRGIGSRLASAAAKLGGGGSASAARADALVGFHDLLAHLPRDVRFRISDVTLDATRWSIEGEAPSDAQAQAVAAALGQSPRWTVDDPRIGRGSGGTVHFTISATAAGDRAARTVSVP